MKRKLKASESEECSSRAERGSELVIKEKCRRLGGICGSGGEKVISGSFFWPALRGDLPESTEPLSSGLLLWDGFYPRLGLNLFPEQTYVGCHRGIWTTAGQCSRIHWTLLSSTTLLHMLRLICVDSKHLSRFLLAYKINSAQVALSYALLGYLECKILWQNKAKGRKLLMKARLQEVCVLITHMNHWWRISDDWGNYLILTLAELISLMIWRGPYKWNLVSEVTSSLG